MIREIHKVVSDWNNWYDKYVVYYVSGRKIEYCKKVPKTVLDFTKEAVCEWVSVGNYFRYYKAKDKKEV